MRPLSLRAGHALACLALGLWAGAIACLSFAAAPTNFQVLPSRKLAGEATGATLRRINRIELACAAASALGLAGAALARRRLRRPDLAAFLLVLVMSGLLARYAGGLSERMKDLRARIADMDLPADLDPSPERREFDGLHHQYVALMGANLFLAAAAAVLLAATGPGLPENRA
ncbi:MAG: DUF4149 domain-containing protein [Planctomycetes bacterium]|nr:DUF4149 domain-containing protein [Planctomycetota bacterium]